MSAPGSRRRGLAARAVPLLAGAALAATAPQAAAQAGADCAGYAARLGAEIRAPAGFDGAAAVAACAQAAAADPGSTLAAYRHARMLLADGQTQAGVSQAQRAADAGHADAQLLLGSLAYRGEIVPRSLTTAFSWIERAAEGGSPSGQALLAVLYLNGEGVAPDMAQAAAWFRRAAENGNVDGMNGYASMLMSGHGVAADPAEALRYFERAAAGGSAQAHLNLAKIYHHGAGVRADRARAIGHYRKARERGLAEAATALAALEAETGSSPSTAAPSTSSQASRSMVAQVQRHLKALGYDPGADDGLMGLRTRKALRLFKANANLPEDATIDRTTVDALNEAVSAAEERRALASTATESASPRADPRVVADIQSALSRLGYDPGPADGVAGIRTRTALRDFLIASGRPANATLDGPTLDLLLATVARDAGRGEDAPEEGAATPASGRSERGQQAFPGAMPEPAGSGGAAFPGAQ